MRLPLFGILLLFVFQGFALGPKPPSAPVPVNKIWVYDTEGKLLAVGFLVSISENRLILSRRYDPSGHYLDQDSSLHNQVLLDEVEKIEFIEAGALRRRAMQNAFRSLGVSTLLSALTIFWLLGQDGVSAQTFIVLLLICFAIFSTISLPFALGVFVFSLANRKMRRQILRSPEGFDLHTLG